VKLWNCLFVCKPAAHHAYRIGERGEGNEYNTVIEMVKMLELPQVFVDLKVRRALKDPKSCWQRRRTFTDVNWKSCAGST